MIRNTWRVNYSIVNKDGKRDNRFDDFIASDFSMALHCASGWLELQKEKEGWQKFSITGIRAPYLSDEQFLKRGGWLV